MNYYYYCKNIWLFPAIKNINYDCTHTHTGRYEVLFTSVIIITQNRMHSQLDRKYMGVICILYDS